MEHRYEIPPDHLLLDSAPNLGPLISRWEKCQDFRGSKPYVSAIFEFVKSPMRYE